MQGSYVQDMIAFRQVIPADLYKSCAFWRPLNAKVEDRKKLIIWHSQAFMEGRKSMQ